MIEYWGTEETEKRCKPVFMRYINKRYSNKNIILLRLFNGYSPNPFLQIKFVEEGKIHNHKIKIGQLPKYCFK